MLTWWNIVMVGLWCRNSSNGLWVLPPLTYIPAWSQACSMLMLSDCQLCARRFVSLPLALSYWLLFKLSFFHYFSSECNGSSRYIVNLFTVRSFCILANTIARSWHDMLSWLITVSACYAIYLLVMGYLQWIMWNMPSFLRFNWRRVRL